MKKNNDISRRTFLKDTAATTAGFTIATPFAGRVLGANNRIRVGFIGIGNRGSQLLHGFMRESDVEVAALCDVYQPYLERDKSKVDAKIISSLHGGRVPSMGEKFEKKIPLFKDFRKLLEMKDLDAVCIATPDHWHAIQTIMACEAGLDVYVEKPLTITIVEGRKMIEAEKRTNRVVQVGLNRRASSVYQKMIERVKKGALGKVSMARAYRISNMAPDGIGKMNDADPPEGFDWDMWLGPRAYRPYRYNIAPYKFRWWQDYSSQMGNWGVHYMDAIRWLIGEEAPIAISAHGSHNVVRDDRTIPDTMEVTFEFASGAMVIFGIYEASGGSAMESGEVEIRGTEGNLYIDERGHKIVPTSVGQFREADSAIRAEEEEIAREDITQGLIRNFLDCVKSRQTPYCELETGHRSTSFAHLANIALAVQSRIEWNPKAERITNNKAANDLLHYEYRKPWTL